MDKIKIQIPIEYKELHYDNYRYFLIHGGRNSGKSYNVALALLLKARKETKRILCTREIQNTIKDSVHKLLSDLITTYEFNDYIITEKSIYNQITGSEFIFKGLRLNYNEIKSTEGVDIAWVEEAQSVSKQSLDVLIPTIRKTGSQIYFTFNRFSELDPVYEKFFLQTRDNTYIAHINYDILIKYNLLTDEIKQEIEYDKKNNPEAFAHIWLGEPISQSEYSIISRTDILEAMQRKVEDDGQTRIGVDVARMGDDRTVLWKIKGLKTIDYQMYHKKRTTEVVELIEAFVDFNKEVEIKVDDTGVGGGVTDQLIQKGYNVIAVNFGAEPSDKDKYPNLISEAWFYLKSIIGEIQLPHDRDLLMELSTRQWKQDSRGKRCIEGKQDYKKRGYRSPDIADSCILAYYTPQVIEPTITVI